MKKTYTVTLNQPDDVSDAEMKEYIDEAVSSWGGQYHPESPLFTGYWDSKVIVKRKYKDNSK